MITTVLPSLARSGISPDHGIPPRPVSPPGAALAEPPRRLVYRKVATRSTSRGVNQARAWETIRPSQLYGWPRLSSGWLSKLGRDQSRPESLLSTALLVALAQGQELNPSLALQRNYV